MVKYRNVPVTYWLSTVGINKMDCENIVIYKYVTVFYSKLILFFNGENTVMCQ